MYILYYEIKLVFIIYMVYFIGYLNISGRIEIIKKMI